MPGYIRLQARGYAAADSDFMTSKNNQKYTRFKMCVNTAWGNQKRSLWIQVLAFKNIPMNQGKNIKKGDFVEVVGMPIVDKYVDRNGVTVPTLNVYADEVYIIRWYTRAESEPLPEVDMNSLPDNV